MMSQLKQLQVKIHTVNAAGNISTVHCSMEFQWIMFLGEQTAAFIWLVKSYESATDSLHSWEPHPFYYHRTQGNAAIVWLKK